VREFMRSPAATPFIERAKSIQHETVFLAKIRPAKVVVNSPGHQQHSCADLKAKRDLPSA
jgi:hypothetical protein